MKVSIPGPRNGNALNSLHLHDFVSVILALIQFSLLQETLDFSNQGQDLFCWVTLSPRAGAGASVNVQEMLNKEIDEQVKVDETVSLLAIHVATLYLEIQRG